MVLPKNTIFQANKSLKQKRGGLTFCTLHSPEDFLACVDLQNQAWPESTIPVSLLAVLPLTGGLVAGAFNSKGRLLGCVTSSLAKIAGKLAHWSNRLVVSEEARDMNIGGNLKEFQKAYCLDQGIKKIYWSYDPLIARNAHLNLNKLGAKVVEYVEDMYAGSERNDHGMGSDRFIVEWNLIKPNRGKPTGDVKIEIPETMPDDPKWRLKTRNQFQSYLKRGYRVAGFNRDKGSHRCFYFLKPTE